MCIRDRSTWELWSGTSAFSMALIEKIRSHDKRSALGDLLRAKWHSVREEDVRKWVEAALEEPWVVMFFTRSDFVVMMDKVAKEGANVDALIAELPRQRDKASAKFRRLLGNALQLIVRMFALVRERQKTRSPQPSEVQEEKTPEKKSKLYYSTRYQEAINAKMYEIESTTGPAPFKESRPPRSRVIIARTEASNDEDFPPSLRTLVKSETLKAWAPPPEPPKEVKLPRFLEAAHEKEQSAGFMRNLFTKINRGKQQVMSSKDVRSMRPSTREERVARALELESLDSLHEMERLVHAPVSFSNPNAGNYSRLLRLDLPSRNHRRLETITSSNHFELRKKLRIARTESYHQAKPKSGKLYRDESRTNLSFMSTRQGEPSAGSRSFYFGKQRSQRLLTQSESQQQSLIGDRQTDTPFQYASLHRIPKSLLF
eukprot:TRINITY_DN18479_c0_g1_i2.p1 TRINITY_DN18479_c0_g1~~TRINITY_DN18479_c0_g1_i2.p1  ORF type:complete len:429 (+),score=100.79 TRINITY_DN18479_c0_g1_i2:64-1350(+)